VTPKQLANKKYREEHKEEIALSKKLWCEQNKEHKKQKAREWYQKNRELTIARSKAVYEADPDNYRLKMKQNYQKHKTAYVIRSYNRTERIKQASPKWDQELTEFVFEEAQTLTGLREYYTNIKWHVDHVVPLQGKYVSGLHVWNNFQVIPAKINLSKRNKYAP